MTHGTPLGQIAEAGRARSEILDAQQLLGDLADPDRLFRPFGGGGALGPHLLNEEAVATLKEERMTCVLWNAIPRDFAEPANSVDRALEQCRAQPWTLLVLHDLPNGAMKRADAPRRRYSATTRLDSTPIASLTTSTRSPGLSAGSVGPSQPNQITSFGCSVR